MLVSFSVSNFRSFDGEQTFSLVASNRLSGKHEGHLVAIPNSDSRVLRAGVIYGANGAGKSNLFKALRLLKAIATSTRKKGAPIRREAFRFGDRLAEPTTFDLQFISHNQLFRYGVKVNDTQVLEEWLMRISDGTEKSVYERISTADGGVQVELGKAAETNSKFNALARIGGPRNQSFLATIWSTLDGRELTEDVIHVYLWFMRLGLVSPRQSETGRLWADPGLLEFASDFLRSSSTGVESLAVVGTPLTEEEFTALVPRGSVPELSENGSSEYLLPNNDVVVRVERDDGLRYSRRRLQALHHISSGGTACLDLPDESDGTRRLLQLIPALHQLRSSGNVYVIDEIDRSLHPMMVRNFLEFFLNSREGEHRQLIVTTHESSLLDQDLLRRDEIWFAEKDKAGATSLYSLLDFKVRNDLEIRKHYLQGRFGAVPFLGGIKRLMEDEGQPA